MGGDKGEGTRPRVIERAGTLRGLARQEKRSVDVRFPK